MCGARLGVERRETEKKDHMVTFYWSIGCPHNSQVAFDLQKNERPNRLRTDKNPMKIDKNDPDTKV